MPITVPLAKILRTGNSSELWYSYVEIWYLFDKQGIGNKESLFHAETTYYSSLPDCYNDKGLRETA